MPPYAGPWPRPTHPFPDTATFTLVSRGQSFDHLFQTLYHPPLPQYYEMFKWANPHLKKIVHPGHFRGFNPMSVIGIVFVSVGVIFMVFGIIGISYTYYLFKKVVPRIDEIIHGHRFMFDTWLTLLLRMQEYAAWSTFYEYFPRLAEKRGWAEKAAKIPRKTRHQLIISMLIPAVVVLLVMVGRLMMYLYPELDKSRHEITQQVETSPQPTRSHPVIRDKPWSGDRPDNSKSQETGGITAGGDQKAL